MRMQYEMRSCQPAVAKPTSRSTLQKLLMWQLLHQTHIVATILRANTKSLHCCGEIKENGHSVLPSNFLCRKPLKRINCSFSVVEQPFDFCQALETGYKIIHVDQLDLDVTVLLLLRSGRHSTTVPQKRETPVVLIHLIHPFLNDG